MNFTKIDILTLLTFVTVGVGFIFFTFLIFAKVTKYII